VHVGGDELAPDPGELVADLRRVLDSDVGTERRQADRGGTGVRDEDAEAPPTLAGRLELLESPAGPERFGQGGV
jgi:hypothetical protein